MVYNMDIITFSDFFFFSGMKGKWTAAGRAGCLVTNERAVRHSAIFLRAAVGVNEDPPSPLSVIYWVVIFGNLHTTSLFGEITRKKRRPTREKPPASNSGCKTHLLEIDIYIGRTIRAGYRKEEARQENKGPHISVQQRPSVWQL